MTLTKEMVILEKLAMEVSRLVNEETAADSKSNGKKLDIHAP